MAYDSLKLTHIHWFFRSETASVTYLLSRWVIRKQIGTEHLYQHSVFGTHLPSVSELRAKKKKKDNLCKCSSALLPAVLAAVLLCDPIFIFAPKVHRWKNQSHQHSKAAHQGKDHDALLLRLQGKEREHHWFPGWLLYSLTLPWKFGDLMHSSAAHSWTSNVKTGLETAISNKYGQIPVKSSRRTKINYP